MTFTLRRFMLLTIHIGVGCRVFVAPVGEGAELTRQYLWDFKTWEVCMFVQNRQIDLCQHLVHLERQTPNLSEKGAFMV